MANQRKFMIGEEVHYFIVINRNPFNYHIGKTAILFYGENENEYGAEHFMDLVDEKHLFATFPLALMGAIKYLALELAKADDRIEAFIAEQFEFQNQIHSLEKELDRATIQDH